MIHAGRYNANVAFFHVYQMTRNRILALSGQYIYDFKEGMRVIEQRIVPAVFSDGHIIILRSQHKL